MVGSAAVVVANFPLWVFFCEYRWCYPWSIDHYLLTKLPLLTLSYGQWQFSRQKSHGLRLESDRMAQCWYLKNGPLTAGAIVSRSRSGASRGQLQPHGATELGGRCDRKVRHFSKGGRIGKRKTRHPFLENKGFWCFTNIVTPRSGGILRILTHRNEVWNHAIASPFGSVIEFPKMGWFLMLKMPILP
jgi:hypothetical protein